MSVTTVSHVLNNTREIAPETRRRVLEAIGKLNYYKNNSARLLVRGHSDTMGLIISDIENPFLPELVKSFERAASDGGMEVLLGMTNYEPRKAEAAVRRMIEARVRGVAAMTSQLDSRLVDRLFQAGLPAALLTRIGRESCGAGSFSTTRRVSQPRSSMPTGSAIAMPPFFTVRSPLLRLRATMRFCARPSTSAACA